jgi:glyoxylase-like metal-dependent hydrolase (beta-lactamase superfamily II)
MVFEIDKDIYRIIVPLAGSPLGTLNAYFFRGPEEDYLMDTGFNTPECEASLRDSLARLGWRPERLNIINTHLHMDHTGLNHRFVGEKGRIFISGTDLDRMVRHYRRDGYKRGDRDRREGADADYFETMLSAGPERESTRRLLFDEKKNVPLADGQVLDLGPCRLQTVVVPGHTPGNAMFYVPGKRIMFTGDHVLFDITPNITFWPEYDNALQHYLDSLEASKRFDVALALPGHRDPGNYRGRIEQIELHHRRRLDEIVGIVGNEPGLTAYEIARRMRWRIHTDGSGRFPPAQMWFAAGECMSHLDKLVADGRMLRIEGEPYVTYRLP